MHANGNETGTSVVPTIRYRDVPAAIEWLCKAFGLEEHRVVTGKNGSVRYAQLTFGSGMVMVAPIQESTFGKLMVQPDEIGGVETQICYLFVENAKAHYARAKAAGAEIVLDIDDEAKGGRGYSCRDPEGHVWNFGTYDPWERQSVSARQPRRRSPSKAQNVAALLCLSLIAAVGFTYEPAQEALSEVALTILSKVAAAVDPAQAAQAREQWASEAAARTLRDAREQAVKERTARATAERAAKEARDQLAQERRSREISELAAKEARERQVQGHSTALEAAERAAAQAREQLAQARSAQEAGDRAAAEIREQLEQARTAKETAERAAEETNDQLSQVRSAKEAAEKAAKVARYQAIRERRARIRAARSAAASPYLYQ